MHHANLPKPRKTPPYLLRGERSYSVSAGTTENKEFRHIPNRLIIGDLRTPPHQSEPCKFAIEPDEERMSIGFGPVQWKCLVTEPTVGAYVQRLKLAEIVCIQFKQIGKDRRLLAQCRFKLNIYRNSTHFFRHRWMLCPARCRPRDLTRTSSETKRTYLASQVLSLGLSLHGSSLKLSLR